MIELVSMGTTHGSFDLHRALAGPGARLEVIPDAGHSPQFESTDAWWKALLDVLDGLPRP